MAQGHVMGRPVDSTGLLPCSRARLPLVATWRRGRTAGDGGHESRAKESVGPGGRPPRCRSRRARPAVALSLALVLGLLPATGLPVPTTRTLR
jgi:hypothetical protein